MLFLKTKFITGPKVKVINTMTTDKKHLDHHRTIKSVWHKKTLKMTVKGKKTNVQNAVLKKTRLFFPKISWRWDHQAGGNWPNYSRTMTTELKHFVKTSRRSSPRGTVTKLQAVLRHRWQIRNNIAHLHCPNWSPSVTVVSKKHLLKHCCSHYRAS